MSAFSDCTALASIEIPDSVTSIDKYAFSGCTALTTATIGSSVTEIGSKAFENCSVLEEINSKSTTSPTIYEDTFSGVDKETCVLNVPVDCMDAYSQADYWSEFYNINEEDFSGIENIFVGENAKPLERYTINGAKISTPQRGINIVKYSDGSSKKILVK